MKTIITTDIHGCYKPLCELLNKTEFDEEHDTLIVLGDLVDRGPDSYHVYRKLKDIKDRIKDRCIILMGNHEDMMRRALSENTDHAWNLWEANGSEFTIQSFENNEDDIRNYAKWAESFPYYYETDDYICVHAGLGSSFDDTDSMIWSRDIANRHNYSGKLLIYGHTPDKDIRYCDGIRGPKVITIKPCSKKELPKTGDMCIDTGCVFHYKLSALVIENGCYRAVQVENPLIPKSVEYYLLRGLSLRTAEKLANRH